LAASTRKGSVLPAQVNRFIFFALLILLFCFQVRNVSRDVSGIPEEFSVKGIVSLSPMQLTDMYSFQLSG